MPLTLIDKYLIIFVSNVTFNNYNYCYLIATTVNHSKGQYENQRPSPRNLV